MSVTERWGGNDVLPCFFSLVLSISRWRKLNCSSFPVREVLILLPIFSLHCPVCFWKLLFHPQLHVILPLFGTEWRPFLSGFHFHFQASLQHCCGRRACCDSMWAAQWFGQVNSPRNGSVLFLQEALQSKSRARGVFRAAAGAGGKSRACCFFFPVPVVFLNVSRWVCRAVLRQKASFGVEEEQHCLALHTLLLFPQGCWGSAIVVNNSTAQPVEVCSSRLGGSLPLLFMFGHNFKAGTLEIATGWGKWFGGNR